MTQSYRSRAAAAFAGTLCVATFSAQFALAQHAPPQRAAALSSAGGVFVHTQDPVIAGRVIAAMCPADPATYRIEVQDPNDGHISVLGSLSPDVVERLERRATGVSPDRAARRRWGTTTTTTTTSTTTTTTTTTSARVWASRSAVFDRLSAALRGADAAAYSLTTLH